MLHIFIKTNALVINKKYTNFNLSAGSQTLDALHVMHFLNPKSPNVLVLLK